MGTTRGPRTPELVVGIGASAGGIQALRAFFSEVSAEGAIAYVVILHLSPDYESNLAEVLQATAPIPVTQVREQTTIEANHVYVISPNQALDVRDGVLHVSDLGEERRAPVDHFFRTLADAYRTGAAAVVLSGTGPNGSNGIKRIKELGGLTVAQDPAEAEFRDMPNNSIATGLVDHVLPVARIPRALADYAARLSGPAPALPDPSLADLEDGEEDAAGQLRGSEWRDVLKLLRTRTGQDFSNYKSATIRRRVERRLNVRGLRTLAEYAELMRTDPTEPQLLMKELLISVTNFFRDPEAWDFLERRIIPRIFEGKAAGTQVRVWSAGCATGEEAYSLAILLAEHMRSMLDAPAVQVFASDLDADAIAVARDGLYSDVDVADISPERLQRFFHREAGGYRVRRELRELVLFARHNAIKDPPFSHLDLITCRNLLIYLNRPIQERLIETFHTALRPGGYLMLGGSEAADAGADLFMVVDKSAHVFESRTVLTRPIPPLSFDRGIPLTPMFPRLPEPRAPKERISPGELHLRLLEQYAAPSFVVNEEHTLMHVSRQAGEFLQMTGGEPSRDVLKLAHPDLRPDLRTALHLGAQERSPITIRGIVVHLPSGDRVVRITAKPVLREDAPPSGYFLVLIEDDADAPAPQEGAGVSLTSPAEPEARRLSEELSRTKTQLRATIEQYEAHAEESRAANEELRAMNEELRSAAEELETSKEELQSVNEELTTVNQELKIKIEELRLTNDDFQNLINSTDIGTIFVDRAMRVKLSTPRAQDVFNLLPADTGRKLSDITTRITYEGLHDDMRQVLETLQAIEREVETRDGRWYLMRILPYRTTDNHIDGVTLTFLDITSRRRAELDLRHEEERLRLLIDSVIDYAIFTVTAAGTIESWNAGAQRMYGYKADEIIGREAAVLFTPEDRSNGIPAKELAAARARGRASDGRWQLRKDGSQFYCTGVMTPIQGSESFAKVARDLTERREASESKDQISGLLRRVVTAQEDERARIARDLHDQLGQQLTALRLALQQQRGESPDIDRALQLLEAIDHEVDFLAWELRPATLDDLGLAVALPRFVQEWSTHYKITADFHGPPTLGGSLSPSAETAFYRIAQEALNNVVKHANATRVDVLLEHRDGVVTLVVEDDGLGFDIGSVEVANRGIGLAGMRERAGLIGADIQVESELAKGTTVLLRCAAACQEDRT